MHSTTEASSKTLKQVRWKNQRILSFSGFAKKIITNFNRVHPPGSMRVVCTRFQDNPSNICSDIPLRTKTPNGLKRFKIKRFLKLLPRFKLLLKILITFLNIAKQSFNILKEALFKFQL